MFVCRICIKGYLLTYLITCGLTCLAHNNSRKISDLNMHREGERERERERDGEIYRFTGLLCHFIDMTG